MRTNGVVGDVSPLRQAVLLRPERAQYFPCMGVPFETLFRHSFVARYVTVHVVESSFWANLRMEITLSCVPLLEIAQSSGKLRQPSAIRNTAAT